MSDADTLGTRSISWAEFEKEVELLTQLAVTRLQADMIEAGMVAPDRASWMHPVGVALVILRHALTILGVPPDHIGWMHQKVLLVHDLMHGYMAAGPEGVLALEAGMLASPATDPDEAAPDAEDQPPPGCTLH